MQKVAEGITLLNFSVSNVYLVGEPGGAWVVIDTGLPYHFDAIRSAAAHLYGEDSRPAGILLTHAHADHYGSAVRLAAYWDVPVYAHPLDLPYLTGRATVAPPDPTVGGFIAFFSRFMPRGGTDLGTAVHPLPDDHSAPGLPDWRWLPSPGHTPGHVSFFRESDATLIAGDAVLTVDLDSAAATVRRQISLSRPVTPATIDWLAARKSILRLAALRPRRLLSGHGLPIAGDDLPERLEHFGNEFIPPLNGRYVAEPVIADENGIVYLPPAASDPLPKLAAAAGVAAAVGVGVYWAMRRQSARNASRPDLA
jgi:glyoxylase-like metal-dependent hydrolase (beta-lactamase superfamily II)